MFTESAINKSFDLLNQALKYANNDTYIKRINKLLLGMEYLYLVRLDMDTPNRNLLIDNFKQKLLDHNITEIFERTSLDFAIDVMKKSKLILDK